MDETTQYRDGELVTFRQFSAENPVWTEASLRWLRFKSATNGAAGAGVFIQQGRRVLLCKPAFFRWLRSQQTRVV